MNINIEKYNEIVHRINDEIVHRINDEEKVIRDYEYLLSLTKNGFGWRSILHILNEERDHVAILHKLQKKYREL